MPLTETITWRPIETDGLPEDDTPVRVRSLSHRQHAAAFIRGGKWRVRGRGWLLSFEPTHWAELPRGPE